MASEILIEAGTLLPPACYATEQERFEAYAASLVASLISDDEWVVSQLVPSAEDAALKKHWLQLDGDLRPVMAFYYVDADAAWVPWFAFPVFKVSSGAAGAYGITNSPAFTTTGAAYVIGRHYRFKANHSTTGPSNFNVDGLGPIPIKIKVTEATVADTIKTDQIVDLVFDGVNMQMISAVGGIELIGIGDVTPGVEGQFHRTRDIAAVPTSVWETSSYKTADADMEPMPNAGVLVSFTHGLGKVPDNAKLIMVCIDADVGFSVGDEVHEIPYDDTKRTVWANSTSVNYRPIGPPTTRITNATTGVETSINPTKWNLKAYAMI